MIAYNFRRTGLTATAALEDRSTVKFLISNNIELLNQCSYLPDLLPSSFVLVQYMNSEVCPFFLFPEKLGEVFIVLLSN